MTPNCQRRFAQFALEFTQKETREVCKTSIKELQLSDFFVIFWKETLNKVEETD